MYQVRRVNIGKTAQIDELAHACGELYSQALVFFWRTVRHKGIWLKEKHCTLSGLATLTGGGFFNCRQRVYV